MTRPTTNLITRFYTWTVVGLLLFFVAISEALVAQAARGSAPVAVVFGNGGQQHGTTAAGVGCDANNPRGNIPIDLPADLRRVGGR